MKTPKCSKGAGPAASKVVLLAAVLLLAATASYAQRPNDNGSRGAWRSGGGERARSGGGELRGKGAGGGGEARWKGGGGVRGGGPAYRGGGSSYGGDVRWKNDGGRVRGGGPAWGNGSYRGDSRDRGYSGGRRYDYRRAPRYYGSGYWYGGGWYPRSSYYYRYPRPRTYVSIGLGLPYYCPIRYRHVVVRHPVGSEYRDEVSVDNLPPAGCYYYDPYCDREFPDLDSYTDHVDQESHAQAIEIRDRDTGDWVRTLEFSGGYWVVRR